MNPNPHAPHPQADAEARDRPIEADAPIVPDASGLVTTTASARPDDPKAARARAVEGESSTERTWVAPARPGPTRPMTEGLTENVAGTLCYLFGWVSGLFFLLVDRRPFVRFHAAQSVAVFASLNILLLALSGFFLGALLPHAAVVLLLLARLVELVWLGAAVLLMLKAAGGERFRVRFASRYGDHAAHAVR